MQKAPPICRSLYFQVLLAVAAGILIGHLWPEFGAGLKPLGDGFVKLIKMMIAPIVFCTIALGIANMSDLSHLARAVFKMMGLFYLLTIIALLTGLVAVFLVQPGVGMNVNPALLDPAIAAKFVKADAPKGFVEFFMHIIPLTFLGAFADGEVLPALLLAILVGIALARSGVAGRQVHGAIDGISHVLFSIFGVLMKLAPIAAFGSMAFTVGRYGIKSISSLGLLIGTFYLACLFFVFIVLGTLSRLHGFSLFKLLRYFKDELIVVLGTSSTEPVLPRMLVKIERLGCKKGVCELVLPLGYSFNLDGSAIYLTLASVFIAQACNIHLSLGQILAMLAVMLISSKGAAGVAGGGFVALVATLTVMPDIPVAGVALIVGIDRFMSEARALTGLVSNAVATVVVSIWEGACDRSVLQRELESGFEEVAPQMAAPVPG